MVSRRAREVAEIKKQIIIAQYSPGPFLRPFRSTLKTRLAGFNLAISGSHLCDAEPGGRFMGFDTGLTTGERFTSLFQPDTLIPNEYSETFKRRTHLQPEKRLMLALLEDGVACFQKYATARDGRGRRYFQETQEWILEPPSENLFSFVNVCETLGFDADYLRRGLMRWKATALESRPPARVYPLMSRLERANNGASESVKMTPPPNKVASR
jgi:hypothetical protein